MTVPVDHPFEDLDAVLAQMIRTEEERAPLQGVDAVAVAAIVALSHAGADLMTEASHAGSRDVERMSKNGRTALDAARRLMSDFTAAREVGA